MTPWWAVLLGLGLLAVLGVVVLVLQVDDWGRDLSTNVAETTPDARDPLLRPLVVAGGIDDAARLVAAAATTVSGLSRATRTDSAGQVQLTFVYTSRLFRFKDDVTVWVEPAADGVQIRARAASRVGTGDLGQNPRTLRALFRAIRQRRGLPQP